MQIDTLRLAEHVHGHVGWLTAALLVHPAIVLRSPKRRAHLAVGLATAAVTIVAALGAWLYVAYRARLKQPIFTEAPLVGLAFERKEHLAFGAVLLAWAGCAAYFAAPGASDAVRLRLRRIAFCAFIAAAALAIVVAAIGTWVAIFRSF
jgi:hypothetical protein